jgi:hypothetical protein
MKRYSWLDRLIYRLTARRWNKLINNVLCHQYEQQWIDSIQLHNLSSDFDPTQCPAWKRIQNGQLYIRKRSDPK